MRASNSDKEQIIALVNRLLSRSELTIKQVVARMQARGCDISRTSFENRFTSRIDRYFNISPDWTLALIAALTERLTDRERCTAAEAIELARLTRLPIDQFQTLLAFFPEAEFLTAYSQYAPTPEPRSKPEILPGEAALPTATPEKTSDVFLTCHPSDQHIFEAIETSLAAVGLTLWPTNGHYPISGDRPPDFDQALTACHTWLICFGPESAGDGSPLAGLSEPLSLPQANIKVVPVLWPGTRRGLRSQLPRFLQRAAWFEFYDGLTEAENLAQLAATIKDAIPTRSVIENESYDPPCPYRGLRFFDEAHAEFFFGREADTAWLLEALRDSRFLAVIGPSGSGKSSAVRAGLIPALRQGRLHRQPGLAEAKINTTDINSAQWLIQVLEPGWQPLEALAASLLKHTERSLRDLSQELETDERGLHLLTLEVLARQPDKSHLVLVVDQFEEVFTLGETEAARRAFIANLLYAASAPDGRTVVILTMRADFYSQAALFPDLAVQLADHQLLISPLTENELTQVIIRPAQKVGLSFEPGLVDRLLQDAAAESGALPLLQHALLELWERREGTQLTLAAYQASGGVQEALAWRAEALQATLTAAQREIVRRVMLRLTKLGEGTGDTRRRATLAELVRTPDEEAEVRAVVTHLANTRLVTTSRHRETGQESVEVAHEALIRSWPTLRGWLSEDRAALRLHQSLAEAAGDWNRQQRDQSYLYRGARLAGAEEWAEAHAADLNMLERDFLAASLAARDREDVEQERQRRRVTRSLAIGLVLALIGLVAALGFAVFAFEQQREVEAQRQMTLSRQLAAQSGELGAEWLDLALLLGLQAYQVADTFDARNSLLSALSMSPHLSQYLHGHTDWVWSVAFGPDGQLLASGSADGTIRLWEVETRQPLGPPLTGHSDWVRTVAFSPDGQWLASGSADGSIKLWAVSTQKPGQSSKHPSPLLKPVGPALADHTRFVTDLAFTTDSRTLASSSADGTIRLWDVETRQPLGPPLTGHSSFVLSVAFSPDSKTLVSGGADETIIVWDVTGLQSNPEPPLAHALTNHQGSVFSVRFSPDGQTLASGSADGTIRLWDTATRQAVGQPLEGHTAGVLDLAFSPDGQRLASSSEDKTVIVWDMATRQPLDRPFVGHAEPVLSVAFGAGEANSNRLASGGADGNIILWDTRMRQPLAKMLTGHAGAVISTAFSPDGQTLASGSTDQTIKLWQVASGQPLGPPLEGHSDNVHTLAFSPDGRTLASGGRDNAIILWDTSTRQPVTDPLTGHSGTVVGLAFSPDGQVLVSGDGAGTIMLWDRATFRRLDQLATGHKDALNSLAISPDGKTLATGGNDMTVILWDIDTRQPVGPPLTDHAEVILGLAFSPDGQILASAGLGGSMMLWDVGTRRPIRQPLVGHTDQILTVAFSPDGRTLATGSNDNTMRLWDVATQQPFDPPLTGHTSTVISLAVSPDGQLIASTGADQTVMLWDVNLASWQQQACQKVARNLTQTEWDKYVGYQTYQETCPGLALQASDRAAGDVTPRRIETPVVTAVETPDRPPTGVAMIVEEFDSERGFIQTHPNVYISEGRVNWRIQRNGGKQYVYRTMPAFSGNVRLTARGQVDDWTNNCRVLAGIGDGPGSGIAVGFGWLGGGCPTNGVMFDASGVSLTDRFEKVACEYSGNWLWADGQTPYTAQLTVVDDEATLSVEGLGHSAGVVKYDGPYTTLWVGNTGRGDWPECNGVIESLMIEPLD